MNVRTIFTVLIVQLIIPFGDGSDCVGCKHKRCIYMQESDNGLYLNYTHLRQRIGPYIPLVLIVFFLHVAMYFNDKIVYSKGGGSERNVSP